MKLFNYAVLGLIGGILPCHGLLTKGHIRFRVPYWSDTPKYYLSTFLDRDTGCDIVASSQRTRMVFQMDLEEAQTRSTSIEILNGFWSDVYPYFGVSARDRGTAGDVWSPPTSPHFEFYSVQQTADANLQQKETSFTACIKHHMEELPFQASAIWRYDPSNKGRLTPHLLALNGTKIPIMIRQGVYGNDAIHFRAFSPSDEGDLDYAMELYFEPLEE
ncbi:hypothetical protein CC2G_008222 [Coprinopsis cinerea AmutBmut pab1-1]|nr:hypothetical protein CC2G_008222 [Coprinopsis cinerea AmutBmut pab1-1]